MTLNYLGKYDDLSLLWEAHPNGGIEGEYCYVGDQLLVWDKYSNDWIEGSVEELDAIPTEQSEPESNNGLNYIGRFESEQELWSQYPQGGVEGDYVVIADKEYIWDKYNKEWREATEEDAIRFATVIMQDSEYEYSRLAVTFMGSFEDISQIWKVYPQGGIEGGYIYLGEDKYIWDKYTYSWKPFEPTESSKLRPIEVTYAEGVVGYSEDYINYIGAFDNLDQVWEMYPNGGKDGDYILVNGERLKWNKYTSNWGEDESGETTPARSVATVYGDLHVFNDLVIGDELYARILEELSKKQWVQDNFTSKQWLLDQNYARQEWVLDQYEILQDWVNQRNADIAEWILERGYISEEDISSETVMNLIETDEITITKKDGVLASIATGGQGSVPIITTEDTESVPSDKNVFSAARVASTFLDTTLGGSVLEPVNFKKGIRIGGEAGIDLTYDSDNGALRLGGNAYSLGGLTAGGVGSGTSGGGGGGTSYDRLDSWNDYAPEKVLSALLGKQMYDRIGTIESAGYALTSDLANYQPLATAINTSNIGSQSVAYATNAGSANNANALGGQVPAYYATASALNSLTTEVVAFRALFDELFEKDSANNAIHAKLALWSSGGITAGGVGSGGSGGGGGISYSRLDSWADYSADKSGWVLSALLGNDLNTRLSSIENAGYITASALAPYALRSEIPSLDGYFLASNFNQANIKSTLGISDWALANDKPARVERLTNLDSAKAWYYFYTDFQPANRPPSANYFTGITFDNYDFSSSSQGQYYAQLAISHDARVSTRYYANKFWRAWRSLAFLDEIPTKLSDLTDDVVAGKYLSKSGGTVSGTLSVSSILRFSDTDGTYKILLQRDSSGNILFGGGFSSNNMYIDANVLRIRATESIFSSKVTAPSFIGNLTGNASAQYISHSNRDVNLWDIDNRTARYFALGDTAQNAPSGVYALGSILMEYSWDVNAGAQLLSHHSKNNIFYRSRWNGAFKDWREIAFTDSNVASATKLATPRTIWGQSFDGTQDVTGALTAPAITTNSLTIGGATLTYDSVNEALCINGNMYALGGITAGGAGISTYSSLEARVARIEQQLNIS